ncbi:MAG: nodulation protein NfeD [Prevotellaceae bacterium]|jgi:membrane-bound serine protease (ClpP class)|nr:nodulation protein NfeD [Prevotellaceae bacterium]
MKKLIVSTLLIVFAINLSAKTVYQIDINDEIGSKMWVYTQRGMNEAREKKADLIIIHINTYGGELNFADSIRTVILNSKIPVVAFIDNNAASAGALISLACNRIYMRKGASIGAATVVDGTSGEAMPDKYQSYMRAMMRSTAEAHGKTEDGKWVRDPLIAEAMVDSRVVVPNIDDETTTLTFTTEEAVKNHYCEGVAENIEEVLKQENISDYELITFQPTFWDKTKGVLTSSVLRGLLIMLIIGGIWFELQTPGIGFPLGLAICAAVIYFAPLYIDGLAAYWEIIMFFVGVVLLILEIFVIPGFGIVGVSGIILMFLGLVFSLLGNDYFNFEGVRTPQIGSAIGTVTGGLVLAFAVIILITWRMGANGIFGRLALKSDQKTEEGFIGVPTEQRSLIGYIGVAVTDLRPAGKVEVEGNVYDALADNSKFILNGTKVEVTNFSTAQIGVKGV